MGAAENGSQSFTCWGGPASGQPGSVYSSNPASCGSDVAPPPPWPAEDDEAPACAARPACPAEPPASSAGSVTTVPPHCRSAKPEAAHDKAKAQIRPLMSGRRIALPAREQVCRALFAMGLLLWRRRGGLAAPRGRAALRKGPTGLLLLRRRGGLAAPRGRAASRKAQRGCYFGDAAAVSPLRGGVRRHAKPNGVVTFATPH